MKIEKSYSLILLMLAITFSGCAHFDGPGTKTQMTMTGIKKDLQTFAETCGFFPEAPNGLTVLRENPCSKKITSVQMDVTDQYKIAPLDMWGRRIEYIKIDGINYLRSLGADGQPGGSGLDADILLKVR
jgi:general secretion pathway protein G